MNETPKYEKEADCQHLMRCLLIMCFVCLFLGLFVGYKVSEKETRGEAVCNGVASWTYETNSVGIKIQNGFEWNKKIDADAKLN